MNTMATTSASSGLVTKFAERYSVDPSKLMTTLKATAFKQRNGEAPSNEQMMALMVVADQYRLNPFTREIYAFPDKQNGIVPVVGVDGWARIINSHPDFNGMEFRYSDEMTTPEGAHSTCHEWVECVMYRKDREHPIVVREYLDEVYRKPFKKDGRNGPYVIDGPWQTHPKRFLRHKVTIQCARLAFGFVGIFDPDEAERIETSQTQHVQASVVDMPRSKSERVEAQVVSGTADPVDAEVHEAPSEPQEPGIHGISDSMERLLIEAARSAGLEREHLLQRWPRIDTENFNEVRAELKAMTEAA